MGDLCFHFSSLFDGPARIVSNDLRTVGELYYRKPLMVSYDVTDRAICISGFEIIFDEHDTSSFFENKGFWCETSFFERFDERK